MTLVHTLKYGTAVTDATDEQAQALTSQLQAELKSITYKGQSVPAYITNASKEAVMDLLWGLKAAEIDWHIGKDGIDTALRNKLTFDAGVWLEGMIGQLRRAERDSSAHASPVALEMASKLQTGTRREVIRWLNERGKAMRS